MKISDIFENKNDVLTNANSAYNYAKDVLHGPFPEGEKVIATDMTMSLEYAQHVLKGEFKLGENIIKTNAYHSYLYARDALKGQRFPEGENTIASDARHSFLYARDIIKGRWKKGEPAILNDFVIWIKYISDVSFTEQDKQEILKNQQIINMLPINIYNETCRIFYKDNKLQLNKAIRYGNMIREER